MWKPSMAPNHRIKLEHWISLVVQWLRLHPPKAGGLGSIPGQGTRSHMLQFITGHARACASDCLISHISNSSNQHGSCAADPSLPGVLSIPLLTPPPFTWHNWPLLPLGTSLTSHLLIPTLTYWPDFCILGKLTEIFIHALHLAVNSRLLLVICLSDLWIIYLTHLYSVLTS